MSTMRAAGVMAVVGLMLAVLAATAQACVIQDIAPAGGGSGPNGSYRPGDQLNWTLYSREQGVSDYTVSFEGETRTGTIDPGVSDTATGKSFTVPDLGSQPRTLTLSGAIGDSRASKPIQYAPAPSAAPQAQTAPAGGGTTAGSDAAPATVPAASPQPKAAARVTPRTRPSARGPATTSRPSAHRVRATTPPSSGHTTTSLVPARQRTNAAPRTTVLPPAERATGPVAAASAGRTSATEPARGRTRAHRSRPAPTRTSSPLVSALRPTASVPTGDTTGKPDRRPLALIGALLLIGLLGLGLRGRGKLAVRVPAPEEPTPRATGALIEDPVEEELQTMIAETVAGEPTEAPHLPV